MEALSFEEITRTLRRQWWLIAGVTLTFALLAGLYTYLAVPQTWKGRTTVLFDVGDKATVPTAVAEMQEILGGRSDGMQEHFQTILQSRTVLEEIIEEFNLEQWIETETRADLIEDLRSRVQMSQKSPNAFQLIFTWTGRPRGLSSAEEKQQAARMAAEITNSLVAHLRDFLAEAKYTRASRRREFLEQQLHKAENELLAYQDELVEWATEHDMVAPSSQASAAVDRLKQLRQQEATLSAELEGAREAEEAAMQRLSTQERLAVSSISEQRDPLLDDLRQRMLDLRQQIAEQTEVEGKSARHPDVQRLQAQLDEVQAQLASEVSDELETRSRQMSVDPRYSNLVSTALAKALEREELHAQLSETRSEIAAAMSELSQLPSLSSRYESLQRQVELKAEAVARLTAEYEAARIAEASEMDYVVVLDEAVPAPRASSPSLRMSVGAAGVMGLVVSILLAFWRQGTINARREDAQASADLPA